MTTKNEDQEVSCENCGCEWKIERFWKDSEIVASLIKCPLCGEKQKMINEEEILQTLTFVRHIKAHLKDIKSAKVICKICNKTIDKIYDEECTPNFFEGEKQK